GTYGSFAVNATTGVWTYSLDNAAHQNLAAGETHSVTFTVTGPHDQAAPATQNVTIPITGTNDAPVITADGGGATASISIVENSSAVTTVHATDVDSASVTYSIVGGADASKFTINAQSGALSFVTSPDFENPTDSDHNNTYLVQVQASDGIASDLQSITVNVTNVN